MYNTDGKTKLVFNDENKGELYSINDNECGTFGIGANGELEIESLQKYNIITSSSL